jgi:hypothetical protein
MSKFDPSKSALVHDKFNDREPAPIANDFTTIEHHAITNTKIVQ